MTTMFEVEKFDGRNDFSLWRIKMHALLFQQRLSKTLKGKEALLTMVSNEENDELMEKSHNAILLCLGNEVLREVVEEDTTTKLWLRLESLYMTKSLTNCLYLKKQFNTLQMKEGMPIKDHLDVSRPKAHSKGVMVISHLKPEHLKCNLTQTIIL